MPLDPTPQDKRGIVKKNFDGTFASVWAAGNKPQGEIPGAITNLSASPGPAQSTLSWTPSGGLVRIFRRDDTAGGTFSEVANQISGSANMYADLGLTGDNAYSYYAVAYNQYGEASPSTTVSVTTGAELGEARQLQAEQYAPTRMPLQWANPNGSETLDRSAFLRAHSDFDYERKVTVLGGSAPYYFYLTDPVSGVSIERRAPSWNPYLFLWASLKIDRTQFQSGTKTFTINCVDQVGTVISLTMTVTLDNSKFVVADNVNGSSAGVGSVASPYGGLLDIFTSSGIDATHAGKTIVLRGDGGDYIINNFDASLDSLLIDDNKPSGWIPYPGETISFDNQANIVLDGRTSLCRDLYFGPATYNGGDAEISNTRVFSLLGEHDSVTLDEPRFINPPVGSLANDNCSCIFAPASLDEAGHRRISVIDGYWQGLIGGTRPGGTGSINGMSAMDMYTCERVAFVGGTLRDCNPNYAIWVKGKNHLVMVGGVDGYDVDGQEPSKLFHMQQGRAGELADPAVVQVVGCKGRTADGIVANKCLAMGDSNTPWGSVYYDRMTAVGSVGFDGGESAINGNGYLSDSLIFNDDSEKFPAAVISSNVVAEPRSSIGNYLDANGSVTASLAGYGTIGAQYAQPETV